MLKIRKIQPADAQALTESGAPLLDVLPAKDFAAAVLSKGGTVFLMYEDGVPAGLCALASPAEDIGEKPRCARLLYVAVQPASRRHGLGRILTGLAANEVAERTEEKVWFLAADAPAEPDAAAFAAAMGMKPATQLPGMLTLDLSDVSGLRFGGKPHPHE